MILFGGRATRDERRKRLLRPGALLALMAMFGQMLVALLPMPAMAGTLSSLDRASICLSDANGHQQAPKPTKSSGHADAYCPVCQAVQLLGSLVPPAQPAVAVPRDAGTIVRSTVADDARPHRTIATNQARAPPPSV